MSQPVATDRLTTLAELEALYGAPALRSVIKETGRITPEYRALIEASPFVVLASAGPEGLDCSPRGDAAPVLVVLDDVTLLLPDRPGNNRIDTLRNIVRDPRVALLCLIPGVGESIRVNGRAGISVAPDLLARCVAGGKPPLCVVVIHVESVYFQCARAVVRAGLWDASRQVARASLPSTGEIIKATTLEACPQHDAEPFDAAAYDAELPGRIDRTLY